MAEGEVSLWIRVRDGFTAGINSAKSALNGMVTSSADVARGASTAIGGELSRIWSAISSEMGRVLGDIPGVRKLGGALKGSIAAVMSGAVAAGMGIKSLIESIGEDYRRLAREMEQTGIEIAAKQEQIISKFKSSKTAESDVAIERDLTGEIAQLEKKIAAARQDIDSRGAIDYAKSWWGGTLSVEEENIRQMSEAVNTLKRQREMAKGRADTRTKDETAGVGKDYEQFQKDRQDKAAFDAASDKEKQGILSRRAEEAQKKLAEAEAKTKDAGFKWTKETKDNLIELSKEVDSANGALAEVTERIKKSEDERIRTINEEAYAYADAIAEHAAEARRAAMAERGKNILAQARGRGEAAIEAAQRMADRANFRNRPQTFKEQLDAFIARRDEQRAAVADNQKLLEREAKIREKLQRGIGISKKDEQLLKDMAQLRAGQRADAAAAARKKQVEDAIINLEKKVESVLQASGGPN